MEARIQAYDEHPAREQRDLWLLQTGAQTKAGVLVANRELFKGSLRSPTLPERLEVCSSSRQRRRKR